MQEEEDKQHVMAYQETADQASDEHQESHQADEDKGPEGEVWGDKWLGEPRPVIAQGLLVTPLCLNTP